MLEQDAGELQRELSHLLSALIQLQPLLRNLQLEVKIMPLAFAVSADNVQQSCRRGRWETQRSPHRSRV